MEGGMKRKHESRSGNGRENVECREGWVGWGGVGVGTGGEDIIFCLYLPKRILWIPCSYVMIYILHSCYSLLSPTSPLLLPSTPSTSFYTPSLPPPLSLLSSPLFSHLFLPFFSHPLPYLTFKRDGRGATSSTQDVSYYVVIYMCCPPPLFSLLSSPPPSLLPPPNTWNSKEIEWEGSHKSNSRCESLCCNICAAALRAFTWIYSKHQLNCPYAKIKEIKLRN